MVSNIGLLNRSQSPLRRLQSFGQLISTPIAELSIFLFIGHLRFSCQGTDPFQETFFFLFHPLIAHRFMFTRIRLDFRPVQRHTEIHSVRL